AASTHTPSSSGPRWTRAAAMVCARCPSRSPSVEQDGSKMPAMPHTGPRLPPGREPAGAHQRLRAPQPRLGDHVQAEVLETVQPGRGPDGTALLRVAHEGPDRVDQR